MALTNSLRAGTAITMVTMLVFALSGVALAAMPQGVPKSGASHNCVATTSGILYSRAHKGTHLGQDIGKIALQGGQAKYVQGALLERC